MCLVAALEGVIDILKAGLLPRLHDHPFAIVHWKFPVLGPLSNLFFNEVRAASNRGRPSAFLPAPRGTPAPGDAASSSKAGGFAGKRRFHAPPCCLHQCPMLLFYCIS